jgi:hypothetical protein
LNLESLLVSAFGTFEADEHRELVAASASIDDMHQHTAGTARGGGEEVGHGAMPQIQRMMMIGMAMKRSTPVEL